jgi:nitroimidazol reductase NimA-like FMN-containing flavoprotein (pyridoxamine 5'-phosphate oxidase superfamily)
MLGVLNETEIEEVLAQNHVGRIGCHANGRTYVVPLSYAYSDGCVYAHTHEGLKIQMMRKNPSVCFQVDTMTDMSNWKSVIAWGEFEEITDGIERSRALKILMKRKLPLLTSMTTLLSDDWPFHTEEFERIDGIVYKISLVEKSGRFELNGTSSF